MLRLFYIIATGFLQCIWQSVELPAEYIAMDPNRGPDMLLRQHIEDSFTHHVRAFLERKYARGEVCDPYERDFLLGLRQGLQFTHADLYARRASLDAEERELFDHLNRGFDGLKALIQRLDSIDALNPRQRIIKAAIELGFEDLFHIYEYLSYYARSPECQAAM